MKKKAPGVTGAINRDKHDKCSVNQKNGICTNKGHRFILVFDEFSFITFLRLFKKNNNAVYLVHSEGING